VLALSRMLMAVPAWLSVGVALTAAAAHPTFRADPDYLIDTWDTEEGWPGAAANAMTQTPDGYIWLGTPNGLVRFDGVKFRVFDQATALQLPRASITKLHLDQAGNLWAGTTKGVTVRHGTAWRSVPLPEADNNRGNHLVRSLAERGNGDMLLTTYDGGVLEFRTGQFHTLPPPPGRTNSGYLGLADADGAWWVVQHGFVGKWDGQRWSETVSLTDLPNLASGQVGATASRAGGVWLLLGAELRHYRSGQATRRIALPGLGGEVLDLLEDSRGNVWICTGGAGLWQVSVKDQVRHWSPTNGLADNVIAFAFEDGERNVWIGTRRGGLARLKERTFHSIIEATNRLAFARFALAASPTGGVVIASHRQGLWRTDAEGVTKMALPKPFKDAFVSALSLLVDRAGRLWIGAMTNGVWRIAGQDARWLPIDESGRSPVHALFEDSRSRIWMAGGQSVSVFEADEMRGFGPTQGLAAGRIHAFAEDKAGAIWLAQDRGVFRLESNRWVEVVDAGGASLRMNSLWGDAEGTLWMSSIQTGLACWQEGRLFKQRLPPELPMRGGYTLLDDHLGFFWMTSKQGVLRARQSDLRSWLEGRQPEVTWQVFDVSDGLPATDCGASARDGQGRLWFATERGVARVDPAGDRPHPMPPPVQIEELTYHRAAARVYGEAAGTPPPVVRSRLEWPFPARLTLPPGSRRLEVHYTAFDFAAPEKLRFQTRLEPGDKDWNDVGARRVAYYYDFNPGSYTFRVRAVNHAGVRNEAGASLAFTVQPHLWQALWFKVLGLAVFAAVVYGSVHQRVIRLEKERAARQAFARQLLLSQENERKRVAGELHDGLGQDLLLIKNRLALAAARRADAPELARQLEAATAATTRAIGEVRAISHALRPAALEQVGLTKAIEWMVEQLGEGSATQFSLELDNIDGLLAPEMEIHLFRIIQEGLNNITRHARAKQVILEVKREAAVLRVSLFDDGHGFEAEKLRHGSEARQGLGLASLEERAEYLGGSLDLQSAPERGTRLTVRVPLPRTRA
jgi:signal transduction histidine kinase/ligand-binding sensor domain-containing protein